MSALNSIIITLFFSTILLLGCANPELLPRQGASNSEETLYIGPDQVECVGVAPQQCLQVKRDPNGEWELFYDSIAGFDYEAGFTYQLRVKVTQVANPPADASSLRYELIEVVNKTASEIPVMSQAVLSGKTWHLVEMTVEDRVEAIAPDAEISLQFEGGQIAGSAGCNNYFASYTQDDGSSLTIGPIGSTRKACGGEVDQREFAFLSALAEVTGFESSETALTLIDGNGTARLVFALKGK